MFFELEYKEASQEVSAGSCLNLAEASGGFNLNNVELLYVRY